LEEDTRALLTEESEFVEWKETPREDLLCEAVCAFANDLRASGTECHILFGINKKGAITGQSYVDADVCRAADWIRSGKLVPPVVALPRVVHLPEGDVLEVTVRPCDYPPVRFSNRVYVRIGTTTREATPQEEAVLIERRRAIAVTPDLWPIRDATTQDLDIDFFLKVYLPAAVGQDVLARNQRSTEDRLKAMRMLSHDGFPTISGVLALGFDPRQFIPGAYVQFIRNEGTESTDPILDQKEVSGPLHVVLTTLDGLVNTNIRTATTILDTGREIKNPDYPKSAIMQLLFNAIMHRTYTDSHSPVYLRWYSDRVEIQNPGGPFGQISIENFGQEGLTDYRNPTLAEAMKTLGWVQRFGYGIAEAKRALADNGNDDPDFSPQIAHVHVKVYALR
jgi:ATP-dependent DNA helicase RecG